MPTAIAWLLNVAYAAVLIALSPVIAWQAWRTGKYREGFGEKLLGLVPVRTGNRFCVWLHAVSVGEVNLLAKTLGEIRSRRPEWEIVISTTTKTGYDLARKKYGPHSEPGLSVFYCPLDFSWATRRAVRRVRPDLLVLAELELWPNLIAAVKQHSAAGQGGRVAIINGRLSDNSFRGYSRVGWLVRRVLGQVDLVAAQDEATARRFRALGATNVVTIGSLKYDGAETDRGNEPTKALAAIAGLPGSRTTRLAARTVGSEPGRSRPRSEPRVWLAGSTQAPEESICLDVFKRLRADFPSLRLILVPRHPERFDEVATLLNSSGLPWSQRSELRADPPAEPGAEAGSPVDAGPSILLIDAVGELGAWWGLADVGFVGGSFGDRGGQNMIEPAAYGVATCFGPNTRNFRDIVAALKVADGAREVADEAELEAFVHRCLEEPVFGAALGERAKALVASQLGATARTVDLLVSLERIAAREQAA